MDLWVRSQDKELFEKVNALKINICRYGSINEKDITFDIVVNNDYVFGIYKTKERALEVLDDIESLLSGNTMSTGLVKSFGIRSINTQNLIYEMPKE